MRPGRGAFAGVGSIAISLALLLVLPGVAGAARRASPKPAILSLKVSHAGKPLPARGASVKLTVRVRNAIRCTFYRQPKPRTRPAPFRTVSCKHGHASVRIPAIPNPYQAKVRLTYSVKAIGAHGTSARRKVRLTEAAAPPAPPTASLTASAQSLPWTGGDVTLTYSSTDATSCALTASPALWSGSNPLPVACNGSTPVTVPGSLSGQQWSVTFTATGSGGQKTSSTTLTRQAPSYTPSSNWSGYVVSSSSVITQTSGRFTVPTLDCSTTPNASEAAWVGLGGVLQSDDLLQTGVISQCSGGVQTENPAWWEEFPQYYAVGFASMTVSPGDQIEASVYQQGDGSWVTKVDDLTTGVSGVSVMVGGTVDFGTRLDSNPDSWYVEEGTGSGFGFAGASTAEWVVEDFSDCSSGSCLPVPFADFGTLAFSGLSVNGAAPDPARAQAIGLVQSGTVLSVPTPFTGTGFSLVYTG